MILFSDRGTPYGYRHMNGYSSHSFKWVNAKGEAFLVKYHFKTAQGIKNFTDAEAAKKGMEDKDFSTRDLHEALLNGGTATWNWFVQVMPIADADTYRFDPYDVTKVWPHTDYPLKPVGKIVLNRNPENFHAETEQSAFAPSHLVPGIEPSNDKMLQGRLLNYPDTHRHRLGANYDQIPINCPYRARLGSYHVRDGQMSVNGSGGRAENYEPRTASGPVEDKKFAWHAHPVSGTTGRYPYQHPNDNYEQPRALFRKVMNDTDRAHLIDNISGPLSKCRRDIQERFVAHLYKVDPEYGSKVAAKIGLPVQKAKL
jgi:catalase